MIKVDVISGFLGAGKTTLIKKIFENILKKEKVVLIENEFGEIGVDGSFLKDSGIEIKEINAGCICCSLVGDFEKSMQEIIDKYNPDRIIIEPSGVGKLSDIINAIEKLEDKLVINVLATVVDGPKTKMYVKNFGEFFNNQVKYANTIVISKTDKMSNSALLEVVEIVKQLNPNALIITTEVGKLDSSKLVDALESNVCLLEDDDDHECCCHHHHDDEDDHECCCHHHHEDEDDDDHDCCCGHEHHHHHDDDDEHECCCHHHHDDDDDDDDEHECCCGHEHHHHHGHDANEIFVSIGFETPISITKEKLDSFLATLASDNTLGIIVRSKGILKASDNEKWYYFDYVSGDYEIRLGEPEYTGKVVVIGSKLDENKIKILFYKD